MTKLPVRSIAATVAGIWLFTTFLIRFGYYSRQGGSHMFFSTTSSLLNRRYVNAPAGERGIAQDGPATGFGRFTSPKEWEVWYVGEQRNITWETEDPIRIDYPRPTPDTPGFINTGIELYKFPGHDYLWNEPFVRPGQDPHWDLKTHNGSYRWTVTSDCIGKNVCYFSFHYFFDNNTHSYVFLNSPNFTVAYKPTATPTPSVTLLPASSSSTSTPEAKKSTTSVVGPVVGGVVGGLVVVGVVTFFILRKNKLNPLPFSKKHDHDGSDGLEPLPGPPQYFGNELHGQSAMVSEVEGSSSQALLRKPPVELETSGPPPVAELDGNNYAELEGDNTPTVRGKNYKNSYFDQAQGKTTTT